jgi:serine protease AprX
VAVPLIPSWTDLLLSGIREAPISLTDSSEAQEKKHSYTESEREDWKMKVTGLFIGLLVASSLLFGDPPREKLAPELREPVASGNVDVIVQFDQVPTDAHHQKVISRGGQLKNKLDLVKGGTYTVPSSALADLASDPSVTHISVDHKLSAKLDYSAATINAPAMWQLGWTGSGIGVAVIDSGVAPTQDLNGRVVYTQKFETDGGGPDGYGHGTHVAGIIGGNGSASNCPNCRQLKGMAPAANILDFNVLDHNGESSDSIVIAAIHEAILLKSKYNIRVMNLSLGRPVTESYKQDPLCQAVEEAWKAGIVVVVAAGNDGRDDSIGEHGYGTITAPGNDPYVITVGAMKSMQTYGRADDLIASYSSKGPTLFDNIVKPDIVAPGNQVVSLQASGINTLAHYKATQIPTSYYSGNNNNAVSTQYFMLNGTSMAAAVVSGAVADLLQAHPGLTPDQVKARIMKTAYKSFPKTSVAVDPVTGMSYVSYYDIFTVGAGYLDLAAAITSNYTVQGTAMSPSASFDAVKGTVFLEFDQSSVWATGGLGGTSAVWGTAAMLGTSGLAGNSAVWSTSAVWGTSGIWGTSAVWGTSGIWGTSAVWSTSALWATSANQASSVISASSVMSNDQNVTINGEKN